MSEMIFLLCDKIKNEYTYDIPVFSLHNDKRGHSYINVNISTPIAKIESGHKSKANDFGLHKVCDDDVMLYVTGITNITIRRYKPSDFDHVANGFKLKGKKPQSGSFDSCIAITYFNSIFVMRYDKINETLLPEIIIDSLGVVNIKSQLLAIADIEMAIIPMVKIENNVNS